MSVHDQASRGFELGANAYERGRPGYPSQAVAWLSEQLGIHPGRTVLDVGAGTGKLTRELLPTGAEIVAVEPVAGMREILGRTAPRALVLNGTAEALPVDAESADALVAAQAFHWFDGPAALAEFHRVLRPAGRLGLLWNRRRVEDSPLHHAISEIIDPYRNETPSYQTGAWSESLAHTALFTAASELKLPYEQRVDAPGLVDRVGSTSFIAALEDRERGKVLERVRRLAADTPKPLVLAYVTEVFIYDRVDGPFQARR